MQHTGSKLLKLVLFIVIAIALLAPFPANAGEQTPDGTPTEQPSGQRVPTGPTQIDKVASPTSLLIQDLSSGLTPEQLAQALVGEGVTVSNITYQGASASAGQFSNGLEIVGFDAGIILGSGGVLGTVGPNVSDSYSVNLGLVGDPDLDLLSGYPTYDATVLEFDFVPNQDQVSFQFTFASDEYNEFVHSVFNDVFAFYINGQNCALIDGDPISINTINNGDPYGTLPSEHPLFYLNNDLSDDGGSYDTEMDGLTYVLTCASGVTPNQTNHMKLAIADASDHIYDSAVFIKAGSITTERLPVILVPGMGASFNVPCFFEELFCDTDDLWTWMPVAAEPVYRPLIDRLDAARYTEENSYFSIFYYDWRRPIAQNVDRLKEHIDQIKEDTGKDKVDLIAHSMGGLVSRTYVQGNLYEDDVEHVVTLGTPHKGVLKAYPFWEAAHTYEMGTMEAIAANILLLHYMQQTPLLPPVVVLQMRVAGFKDILPTFNYLRRDDDVGDFIPEDTLKQRNDFLRGLNENVSTLYDRSEIATFVGITNTTTARFYVDKWNIWNGFNWVDGEPNWNRQNEFYTLEGDGTVLTDSGKLDENYAYIRYFPETDHGELPGDNNAINAVFAYLGISVAPAPAPAVIPRLMILIVDGAAQATITDPLGQTLQPPEAIGLSAAQVITGTIPGAEYVSVPGDPYQVIFIPDPLSGDYQIAVNGVSEGDFMLGRLDTFTDTLGIAQPMESFWDLSKSQIQTGTTLTYTLSYSETAQTVGELGAVTPVIELPVWMSDTSVAGRGQPGAEVVIHDAADGKVLGSAEVGEDGSYNATLSNPLAAKQKIYPTAGELTGSTVTVGSYDIFLPMSVK